MSEGQREREKQGGSQKKRERMTRWKSEIEKGQRKRIRQIARDLTALLLPLSFNPVPATPPVLFSASYLPPTIDVARNFFAVHHHHHSLSPS